MSTGLRGTGFRQAWWMKGVLFEDHRATNCRTAVVSWQLHLLKSCFRRFFGCHLLNADLTWDMKCPAFASGMNVFEERLGSFLLLGVIISNVPFCSQEARFWITNYVVISSRVLLRPSSLWYFPYINLRSLDYLSSFKAFGTDSVLQSFKYFFDAIIKSSHKLTSNSLWLF